MQNKDKSSTKPFDKRWDDDGVYAVHEVHPKYGISKTTMYVSMRRGHFPKKIKVGLRRSAFLGRDLNRYDELLFSGALSTEEGKEKLRAEFA